MIRHWEAKRLVAVRAAMQISKPWLKGAVGGNITAAGRRRRGQNSLRSGVESVALALALRYCGAVLEALKHRHSGCGGLRSKQ